jgi:polyisoprenoid-binding protein YceI
MTTATLSARETATRWQIDAAHTEIGFEVKHMMFAKVRGRFEAFRGSVATGAEGEAPSVEVTIDAESVDTGNEQRDDHLRSGDFFDVARFPHLRFESIGADVPVGDRFLLSGALTIRDVTKTVELEVTETGRGTDPWGHERLGFRATTTLDRRDFGLTWNQALETGGILVGNEVRISIEGQAVLQTD